MAKILQKLFSHKCKAKKVQEKQLQVINGYLCYQKRRYSECNQRQKEDYNAYFAPELEESFRIILRKTQLKYV